MSLVIKKRLILMKRKERKLVMMGWSPQASILAKLTMIEHVLEM